MIQTIKKAWGIPELRKKIVFTALILLIFRIGNAIPVPYVDTGLLGTYINQLSTIMRLQERYHLHHRYRITGLYTHSVLCPLAEHVHLCGCALVICPSPPRRQPRPPYPRT